MSELISCTLCDGTRQVPLDDTVSLPCPQCAETRCAVTLQDNLGRACVRYARSREQAMRYAATTVAQLEYGETVTIEALA